MNEIKIEKVYIKSFRNIVDTEYILNGSNYAFKGNNALGKTNILNAIYWCLTGCVLSNASKDINNVPFSYQESVELIEKVVDVAVWINGTKYQRTLDIEHRKTAQRFYINDIQVDYVSNADITILSNFKLLDVVIANKNTKLDILKLLLNPLYLQDVAPIDLRKFVINCIKKDVDELAIYQKLNDTIKLHISELEGDEYNFDIEKYSTYLTTRIKELTAENELLKVKINYLLSDKFVGIDGINNIILAEKSELKYNNLALCQWQEKLLSLNQYVDELTKAYDYALKKHFGLLKIVLLEKKVDGNGYKNVCYPTILGKDIPFANGSTSEKIFTSLYFAIAIENDLKICSLPKLLDECETIDNVNIDRLKLKQSQVIVAKVESGFNEIKGETL